MIATQPFHDLNIQISTPEEYTALLGPAILSELNLVKTGLMNFSNTSIRLTAMAPLPSCHLMLLACLI